MFSAFARCSGICRLIRFNPLIPNSTLTLVIRQAKLVKVVFYPDFHQWEVRVLWHKPESLGLQKCWRLPIAGAKMQTYLCWKQNLITSHGTDSNSGLIKTRLDSFLNMLHLLLPNKSRFQSSVLEHRKLIHHQSSKWRHYFNNTAARDLPWEHCKKILGWCNLG